MVAHVQQDPLWAISSRLLRASSEELIFEISHLSGSLLGCSEVLRVALNEGKNSPGGVSWHKIKTKIVSLLHSKKPEDRWAATVLVKTLVGICGHDILPICGHWVKALLTNLAKSDPPSTKKLAIAILTRIFLLTHGHQTHTKDITAPSIPTYISTCLGILAPKSASVSGAQFNTIKGTIAMILDSFCLLLPKYSTMFKAHLTQIRAMLRQLVVPHSLPANEQRLSALQILSNDQHIQRKSQLLITLLPCCAPKGETGTEWDKYWNSVLLEAHLTASQVFRSVVENWRPLAEDHKPEQGALASYDDQPAMNWSSDFLELSQWSGIQAGCDRLCALVNLLAQLLSNGTPSIVQVSLGRLIDLTNRLLGILRPPTNTTEKIPQYAKNNNQIGDDERQRMWSELINIHSAAINLLGVSLKRFGYLLVNFRLGLIENIATVFRAENSDQTLRSSLCATTRTLLDLGGQTVPKSQFELLVPLIQTSCDDLLPSSHISNQKDNIIRNTLKLVNEKKTDIVSANMDPRPPSDLLESAEGLLVTTLTKVPSSLISSSLRSRLDQVSVLAGLTTPMVASVLNPTTRSSIEKPHSSILPLLARTDPSNLAAECLIRPRRPLLFDSERHTSLSNGEENLEHIDYDFQVLPSHENPNSIDETPDKAYSGAPDHDERPVNHITFANQPNNAPDHSSDTDQREGNSKLHELAEAPYKNETESDIPKEFNKDSNIALSKRKGEFGEVNDASTKKSRVLLLNDEEVFTESMSVASADNPSLSDRSDNRRAGRISPSPARSTFQGTGASLQTAHNETSDDDDESFVIPPLTMDPDTEEEDVD